MLRTAIARQYTGAPAVGRMAQPRIVSRLLAQAGSASSTYPSMARLLSTSRPKSAQPISGPTQVEEGLPKTHVYYGTGTLDAQGAQLAGAQNPEELTTYPDYSKGPSAIEKAAKLFFFTEILRGGCGARFGSMDARGMWPIY